MSDVFISYSKEDRNRAKDLATRLMKEGWSVFWDRKTPIGSTWDEILEKEINATKVIVVLWSKASIGSEWVRTEAEEAAGRKILVPAFIEKVTIPLRFRYIQTADISDSKSDEPDTEGMQLLIEAVARIGNFKIRQELEATRIAEEEAVRKQSEADTKEKTKLRRKQEEERNAKEQSELKREQEEERIAKEQSELRLKQEEERIAQEQEEIKRRQEKKRIAKQQAELKRKQLEKEEKRQKKQQELEIIKKREQAELKRKKEEDWKNKEMAQKVTIGDLKTVSKKESIKVLCEKCNTIIDSPPLGEVGGSLTILFFFSGIIGGFVPPFLQDLGFLGSIGSVVGGFLVGYILVAILHKFNFAYNPIICPKCGHKNYKGRIFKNE